MFLATETARLHQLELDRARRAEEARTFTEEGYHLECTRKEKERAEQEKAR